MKVSLKMILNTGEEGLIWQMENIFKVHLTMIWLKEMEHFIQKMALLSLAYGEITNLFNNTIEIRNDFLSINFCSLFKKGTI